MKSIELLVVIFLIIGCKSTPTKIPQEDRIVEIPSFSSDNAFNYIKKQIDFGPRRMNSAAHEECKNWLAGKLTEFNFQVEIQDFEARAYSDELLKGSNIHGVHNKNVKERILLCAHYDTRHIADKDSTNINSPIDGADDGASGVAVILEIARLINEANLPLGVDIVFFDAEDNSKSNMGSGK